MTKLKLPRMPMCFNVIKVLGYTYNVIDTAERKIHYIQVTGMQQTQVKVTLPFVYHRFFKDWNDFIKRTAEFIKNNSFNECFYWKIDMESKIYWFKTEQLGALREAIEKQFVKDLLKVDEKKEERTVLKLPEEEQR